jgi:hypothetical protein
MCPESLKLDKYSTNNQKFVAACDKCFNLANTVYASMHNKFNKINEEFKNYEKLGPSEKSSINKRREYVNQIGKIFEAATRLNATIKKEYTDIDDGYFSDNSELHDYYIKSFLNTLVKEMCDLNKSIDKCIALQKKHRKIIKYGC